MATAYFCHAFLTQIRERPCKRPLMQLINILMAPLLRKLQDTRHVNIFVTNTWTPTIQPRRATRGATSLSNIPTYLCMNSQHRKYRLDNVIRILYVGTLSPLCGWRWSRNREEDSLLEIGSRWAEKGYMENISCGVIQGFLSPITFDKFRLWD